MALTIPANFETELLKREVRMVFAYELQLDAATLYFSTKTFTWGGNAYTPRIINSTPIILDRSVTRAPETSFTIGNAGNELQSQITGEDLITGRRIKIRLLMENSSGTMYASDSVIIFHGIMQRPDRINENTFQIQCLGLIGGNRVTLPFRHTTTACQYDYADGIDCNFVPASGVTATNAGAAASSIDVTIVATFRVGQRIIIGDGSDGALTLLTVVSNTLTFSGTATWSIGHTVIQDTCNRLFSDCEFYEREHEYGGFRGTDLLARQLAINDYDDENPNLFLDLGFDFGNGPSGRDTFLANLSPPTPFANPESVVPVVYGTRVIKGLVIESYQGGQPNFTLGDPIEEFEIQFLLLSEGECGSDVTEGDGAMYVDAKPMSSMWTDPIAGNPPGLYNPIQAVIAAWGHRGTIGTDADQPSNYNISGVGSRFYDNVRNQLTQFASSYSRSHYAVVVKGPLGDDFEDLTIDGIQVSGIKVQKYSGGVPSGVKVVSNNPIWQALDLCITPRYGLGRFLTISDFNIAAAESSVSAIESSVVDGAGSTTVTGPAVAITFGPAPPGWEPSMWQIPVTNGFNFSVGDTIRLNADPAKEHVVFQATGTWLTVFTDPGVLTIGWIVTRRITLYQCDINIDKKDAAPSVINDILKTCLGYINYDEDGKIKLHIEKAETSTAHFRDTGFADGRGIINESFSWKVGAGRANRVVVRFQNDEGLVGTDTRTATDWADVALRGIIQTEYSVKGTKVLDHAQRLADILLDKFTGGTGAKLETGPYGIRLQPGDVITLTHDVPNWSAIEKRVKRVIINGPGTPKDGLIGVEVEHYNSTIYTGVLAIDGEPDPTLPIINAAVTQVAGTARLTWNIDSSTPARVRQWQVFKHIATMAGEPHSIWRVATLFPSKRKFDYEIADDEWDQTLYFIVRADVDSGAVDSSEVSIAVVDDRTVNAPYNLIHGGDFQDGSRWGIIDTPTETPVSPTANAVNLLEDTTGFTNPANAYDGDTATFASGVFGVTGPVTKGTLFTFAVANRVGYVRVRASAQQDQSNLAGGLKVWFTGTPIDGGSFVQIVEMTGGRAKWFESQFLGTVSMASFQVKARALPTTRAIGATGSAFVSEIEFVELTGAPWGVVGNNFLTLLSDGVSWATVERAWPGYTPVSEFVTLAQDSLNVFRVALHAPSTPDGDIEFGIYDQDSDTRWPCLQIDNSAGRPYSDITSTWHHFAIQFKPTSDVVGTKMIFYCRTKSTVPITVDKMQLTKGTIIYPWGPTPEESVNGYHGDDGAAKPSAFVRQQWAAGVYQRVITT